MTDFVQTLRLVRGPDKLVAFLSGQQLPKARAIDHVAARNDDARIAAHFESQKILQYQ